MTLPCTEKLICKKKYKILAVDLPLLYPLSRGHHKQVVGVVSLAVFQLASACWMKLKLVSHLCKQDTYLQTVASQSPNCSAGDTGFLYYSFKSKSWINFFPKRKRFQNLNAFNSIYLRNCQVWWWAIAMFHKQCFMICSLKSSQNFRQNLPKVVRNVILKMI